MESFPVLTGNRARSVCRESGKKAGIIMKNMADAIESFIIGQMLAASQNAVMVQRNELADRLSCAPSQISYVLSTRFTPDKGYLVESRRGSGGFIRIVRILPDEKEPEAEPTVDEVLDYWLKNEEDKRQVLRQAVKKMVEAK